MSDITAVAGIFRSQNFGKPDFVSTMRSIFFPYSTLFVPHSLDLDSFPSLFSIITPSANHSSCSQEEKLDLRQFLESQHNDQRERERGAEK